jgi:hypothetical protein
MGITLQAYSAACGRGSGGADPVANSMRAMQIPNFLHSLPASPLGCRKLSLRCNWVSDRRPASHSSVSA